MYTFGIIGEGKTDQIVIENILYGFLGDNDPIGINWLQPLKNNADSFGNWLNVIEYCKSNRLKIDLETNDYIIIQIDTDTSEEPNYEVSKYDKSNQELSSDLLIEKVIQKLNNLIINTNQEGFFDYYQEKIIFAVAVHSTECWLLPLFSDKKTDFEATKNCHNRLEKLRKESINKEPRVYDNLSKSLMKQKELYKIKDKNPSLKIFVENLERQVMM